MTRNNNSMNVFVVMMTNEQVENIIQHTEEEAQFQEEQNCPDKAKDWASLSERLKKVLKSHNPTPFIERRK